MTRWADARVVGLAPVLILVACFACGPRPGAADRSAGGTGGSETSETGQITASDTGSPFACDGARWLNEGVVVDDATPPDSLRDIGGIRGNLEVVGSSVLEDLEFLSCLEVVVGNVAIVDNEALVSLHGLEQLRVVGGAVIPDGEFPPEDIESNGGIAILNNAVLPGLEGLESLERTRLSIAGNPSLASLELPSVTSIGQLVLGECPDDAGVAGDNPALTGFGAFERLVEIRRLTVFNQTSLASLESLTALAEQGVEFEDAVFAGNPQLEQEEIDDFAAAAGIVVETCGNKDEEPCGTGFCFGE